MSILKQKPIISTQVINENISVCLRKLKISKEQAFQHGSMLMQFCEVKLLTEQTIRLAFQVSERYQFSYYDSLIVASALENTCQILYSEDLYTNQKIDNQLIIQNPF